MQPHLQIRENNNGCHMQLQRPCQRRPALKCSLPAPVLLFWQYKYSSGWFRLRSHRADRRYQTPDPCKNDLQSPPDYLQFYGALPWFLHQSRNPPARICTDPCNSSLLLPPSFLMPAVFYVPACQSFLGCSASSLSQYTLFFQTRKEKSDLSNEKFGLK